MPKFTTPQLAPVHTATAQQAAKLFAARLIRTHIGRSASPAMVRLQHYYPREQVSEYITYDRQGRGWVQFTVTKEG